MNDILLFTQYASLASWEADDVVGIGAVVAVISIIAGLIIWRNKRIAQEERMKLLEMGYLLPRRTSRWPQALFCTVVGAGVPFGMYLITWMAASTRNTPTDLWIGTCIVSVTAIVGSTIVAGISFGRTEPLAQVEKLALPTGKPAADADALDFAGRMGHG